MQCRDLWPGTCLIWLSSWTPWLSTTPSESFSLPRTCLVLLCLPCCLLLTLGALSLYPLLLPHPPPPHPHLPPPSIDTVSLSLSPVSHFLSTFVLLLLPLYHPPHKWQRLHRLKAGLSVSARQCSNSAELSSVWMVCAVPEPEPCWRAAMQPLFQAMQYVLLS